MKKIIDLMVKAGLKPEVAAKIGESMEEFKTAIREQFEADYTSKVNQAKKVCIEETEAHKRELARRLQVFLETKGAAIDAHLQRQSAMNESEAVTKLRTVKSLIEGIQVEQNGNATNGQISAVVENAKQKIRQLTEERDQAVELLNKKTAIAETVLQRNRTLVTENAKLKSTRVTTVTESRKPTPRLDASRVARQPVTSRPTLVENQETRAPAIAQGGQTRTQGNRNGIGVTDIAAQMDEDLV